MESATIPGPAGALEIATRAPFRGGGPWLVVCHPHPQYGGNMDNSVVQAVASGGAAAGYGVATFNFRGVGRSAGTFAGGAGEGEDLAAVIAHVASEHSCAPERQIVSGYSFGAAVVALQMAAGLSPNGVLWVSPPVSMLPMPDAARDWSGVKHLIAGTTDQFCPPAEAEALCRAAASPVTLHPVTGADHFYVGYESEVAELTRAILSGLANDTQ